MDVTVLINQKFPAQKNPYGGFWFTDDQYDAVEAAVRAAGHAGPFRTLTESALITADYREDRLNLSFDATEPHTENTVLAVVTTVSYG